MTTISHQTSRGRSSSRYISSDLDDYYGPHPTKSAQMIAVVARSRSRSIDRFRSRSRSIDRVVVTKRSRSISRVRSRSRSIDRVVIRERSPSRHRSVSRVVVRHRSPSRPIVVVRRRSPSIDRVVVRRGSSVDALVVRSRSVSTSSPYHSSSVHSPIGSVRAVTTTTRYATDSLHPNDHNHGFVNRHRHHRSGSADLKVVRVRSNSASYMRVHVDRICPETLRYYNVPWEWDSVREFLVSRCDCH
jgi:hypothetical protein